MRKISGNLFLLMLFLAFTTAMTSCGKKEKQAEQALNEFFDAIKARDFEKAKALSTPETQPILDVVIKEDKKFKEHNNKPQEIKIEILDKKIEDTKANFTVRIFVGEKVKTQTINLVYLDSSEIWLVECPKEQLALFRYIVFYDRYDEILVIVNKRVNVVKHNVIIHDHVIKHTVKFTGSKKSKHKWKH